MDDAPLFQNMDEQERIYAPEQLPAAEQDRVRADEGATHMPPNEPPAAAPVANLGNAPSAAMAPPNIGYEDRGGAPGAPNPEAGDPLDSDSR
jgi:hypothetical protein